MKKRAVWIIDEGFLVPALVSVRSFLAVVDMPVTILYCGRTGREKAEAAFAEIDQNIELLEWEGETVHLRPEFAASIQNRLARMDVFSRYADELLLLIDADIVFAEGFSQLIADIEAQPPQGPTLWGVPDQSVAWQNQFYFHQVDEKGRKQRLHPGEQIELYEDIFGPEWRYLLGSHGFNNGLLAVYQCGEVAQKWKELYLRGLSQPKVNPDDDQRSLAAALVACKTTKFILPDKYNSRGEMMGEYVAFHALSGRWRMPFRAFEMGEEPCTDPIATGFGRLAYPYWKMVPQALRRDFVEEDCELIPWRFHALDGPNSFWPLYRSAVRKFEKGFDAAAGHFVEVGCGNGKSTVFMAESIALSGKDIRFDSIACVDRFPGSFTEATENLNACQMGRHVNLQAMTSEEAAAHYPDESLDFVALLGGNFFLDVGRDLEIWYGKVREGGIIVGYDFSSSNKLGFTGGELAIFCGKNKIPFRKNGNFYVIEKRQAHPQKAERTGAFASAMYSPGKEDR